MRAFAGFLRATIVGGLTFLLPIGIALVVLGKLYGFARQAAVQIHDNVFPRLDSRIVPLLIAVGMLVLIAFAAGIFARTAAGRKLFNTIENLVLARLPMYTLMRQTLSDMAGGAERLGDGAQVRVVRVLVEGGSEQLGFATDRVADGRVVVFMPEAPTGLSGPILLVPPDRLAETELSPREVLMGMRRLGSGIARRIAEAHARE